MPPAPSFDLVKKRVEKGGWTHKVTQRVLPSSKDVAGVQMRLTAGSYRELHWHTADEWAYVLLPTFHSRAWPGWVQWARREIGAEVGFGQIAELLVDVEGGSPSSQLGAAAIGIASVLKEHGHKNGHN